MHEVIECRERLLYWRGRIGPVHLIQIDPVGAQPAQGVLDGTPDVATRPARAPVNAVVLTEAAHIAAEFGGDEDVVALALQDRPEAFLGSAVGVRGIEQVDPLIERGVDDGPALLEIEFHAEVVGTQSDHGYGETRIAQPA